MASKLLLAESDARIDKAIINIWKKLTFHSQHISGSKFVGK